MRHMHPRVDGELLTLRRRFLGQAVPGLGTAALAGLLQGGVLPGSAGLADVVRSGSGAAHPVPRAKHVISLFMHGGPSQLELFDYKPGLHRLHGQELPESIRKTQRLTGMTSGQKSFPIAAPLSRYRACGETGAWVSELLPWTGRVVDRLAIVRSLYTEAINHDPAVTFMQTGHQQPGRPSFGAWASYGLGSESANLPAFVVMISRGSAARPADPLYARLWGSGFLPSNHQGTALRAGADPVLYLSNPSGISPAVRRGQLDLLGQLNLQQLKREGDAETAARAAQFELAFRMQSAVPELTDMTDETAETLALYGVESERPGSFAYNCLMARRLVERGVRFVQLYHRGWDQHYNLPSDLRLQCRDVDRASAALILDLERRGLLDETLVVWCGEFGRTVYSQGMLEPQNYGRDHHGGCFSGWLAGGGVRAGQVWGETDDFSVGVVRNPVHVHDLNATLLYLLGVDHTQLTWRFQGRDYRLTDVSGQVIAGLI
ncbi:sulfatase [Planctomycetia bacterium]|nr:sulfatase [Planctomycetia bacterium]